MADFVQKPGSVKKKGNDISPVLSEEVAVLNYQKGN
jgi:hypothetical protein